MGSCSPVAVLLVLVSGRTALEFPNSSSSSFLPFNPQCGPPECDYTSPYACHPPFPSSLPPEVPWDECVDDFKHERKEQFNVVESEKIIASVRDVLRRSKPCLHFLWRRVLVGDQSLEDKVVEDIRIGNVILRGGCLVQTITVNVLSFLQIHTSHGDVDHQGYGFKPSYTVHIPCLVPRILLTYNYVMDQNFKTETGRVLLEVTDSPLTIPVRVMRDDFGMCYFDEPPSRANDGAFERHFDGHYVRVYFERRSSPGSVNFRDIERNIIEYTRSERLKYLSNEVKAFAQQVVLEAFRDESRLFLGADELRKFCKEFLRSPKRIASDGDDFGDDRKYPFNYVETTKIISIVKVDSPCFHGHAQRVLLYDRQLTKTIVPTASIRELRLLEGRLVQSHTVSRRSELALDCPPGSFRCKMTIPCIVPRIRLIYKLALADEMLGSLLVDVYDEPIRVSLNFIRDKQNECIALNEIDDAFLGKYQVYTTFDVHKHHEKHLPRVEILMKELIRKGWPYRTYKKELKEFLFKILMEMFNNEYGVFPVEQQSALRRHCKSITIEPPKPEPIKSPDDFESDRKYPFNFVDTEKVIMIIKETAPCLSQRNQRVLLYEQRLTKALVPEVSIKELRLYSGTLIQSNTVNRNLALTFDCATGSFQCAVTIPCVVPRILLTYKYAFAEKHFGSLLVDVHDLPIDMALSFIRDNEGTCTILNEIGDATLANYRIYTIYEVDTSHEKEIQRMEALMNELTRQGWAYHAYKEELKEFLFKILKEAYNNEYNTFYDDQRHAFRQYCKSVTIQPSVPVPTSGPLPEPHTVEPAEEIPEYVSDESPEVTPIYATTVSPEVFGDVGPGICYDDFKYNRALGFNQVDTKKIRSLINGNYACLANGKETRILIRDRNLTNSFNRSVSIGDLRLYQGCMVQSNTVEKLLKLKLDCTTGSFQCKVTIPCVVPGIQLTYAYSFANIPTTLGVVFVKVYGRPTDITLNIIRDNNNECTISNDIDDQVLADYRVTTSYGEQNPQYIPRVNLEIEQLTREGWPYYTYKEEVKQFLLNILMEVYYQQERIFPIDQQLMLKQYCGSITIQPTFTASTSSPIVEPHTVVVIQDVFEESPEDIDENVYNEYPGEIYKDVYEEYLGEIHKYVYDQYPGEINKDVDDEYPGEIHKDVYEQYPGDIHKDVDDEYPGEIHKDVDNEYPGELDKDIYSERPVAPIDSTMISPEVVSEVGPGICYDDFKYNRTLHFNQVDIKKIRTFINGNYACLENGKEMRILIRDRNLTNSFNRSVSIGDLRLYQGCMVQSNTVEKLLKLTLDCTTGSFQCKVIIPCVVPGIQLTYAYSFANIPTTLGVVFVKVYGRPTDITLNIIRDNNNECTISKDIDDQVLADYRVTTSYGEQNPQYIPRVNLEIEQLTQEGWPYYTYKEEVKQFLFHILMEVYYQQERIFPIDQQLMLKQYCRSITIQPKVPATTSNPIVVPHTVIVNQDVFEESSGNIDENVYNEYPGEIHTDVYEEYPGEIHKDVYEEYREEIHKDVYDKYPGEIQKDAYKETPEVAPIDKTKVSSEVINEVGCEVCYDDFHNDRTLPFNQVATKRIKSLIKENYSCLENGKERVLISDRNLTNTFSPTVSTGDLRLYQGCIAQSNTVEKVLKLTLDCTRGSVQCKVTIPCVVPGIQLTYAYSFANIPTTLGVVYIKIYGRPTDMTLNIIRDNNNECTILNDIDDEILAGYGLTISYCKNNPEYIPRVNLLVDQLVQRGWPYYTYKEEIKQFLFNILMEVYYRKVGLFSTDHQLMLRQYCRSITIQPRIPTSGHDTAIGGIFGGSYDDYSAHDSEASPVDGNGIVPIPTRPLDEKDTAIGGILEFSDELPDDYSIEDSKVSSVVGVVPTPTPPTGPFVDPYATTNPEIEPLDGTKEIHEVFSQVGYDVGHTCRDYCNFERTNKFNILSPEDVAKCKVIEGPHRCFNSYSRMVLIGDRQLTHIFKKVLQIKYLFLSNGCLVQSITVPLGDQSGIPVPFEVHQISGSDELVVIMSCVTPRIVIGYDYTVHRETGTLFIEVQNSPVTLQLKIVINSNRMCYIAITNERTLSSYQVYMVFGGMAEEYRDILKQYMKSTDWLYTILKEEVKAFAYRVVQESFYQSNGGIPRIDVLRHHCDSIVPLPNGPFEDKDTAIGGIFVFSEETHDDYYKDGSSMGGMFPFPKGDDTAMAFIFEFSDEVHEDSTKDSSEVLPIDELKDSPTEGSEVSREVLNEVGLNICYDEFNHDRTLPFNLVDTGRIASLVKENHPCLDNGGGKRVLIGKPDLTNTFSPTASIEDLRLYDGCIAQSTTVNQLLKLSIDCTTGSYQCKVTIPCVVPRVQFTYSYTIGEMSTKIGVVGVTVFNGPTNITMGIIRNNNGKCTIVNEIEDKFLDGYRVFTSYSRENTQYIPRVKMLVDQLTQKGWPYYTYKEEVKQFMFNILMEVYSQEHRVFPDDQQIILRQYCNSITIEPLIPLAPEPSPPPPTEAPIILPETCTDDHLHNRTKEFNIIYPTDITSTTPECSSTERVLIRDRQLSPYFQKAVRLQNVQLSNGCLVQHITVALQDQISSDCDSRPEACIVTIPCVVPRIAIGYNYTYTAAGAAVRGSASLELQDDAISISMVVLKSDDKICSINDEIDEKQLSSYKMTLALDPDNDQVRQPIEQFLSAKPWVFNLYKHELDAFAIRFIQEAFSQSGHVLPPLNGLYEYCDMIVEHYEPVYTPTTTVPTPTRLDEVLPQVIPAAQLCKDDFDESKSAAFNLISPRRVLDLVSTTFSCVRPDRQRVLPGKRLYSPQTPETVRIKELLLSSGCLVQSVTWPDKAVMKQQCDVQDSCVVTVPCVVPRIMIGYSFIYRSPDGRNIPGLVIVEIHNDPVDVPVLVDTARCRPVKLVDETSVLRSWKVTIAPDQVDLVVSDLVKNLMVDHITQTGWLFQMYRDEVEHVMLAAVANFLEKNASICSSQSNSELKTSESSMFLNVESALEAHNNLTFGPDYDD